MSKWEELKMEDKDMIEVKIKIPKNTLAFIINYISRVEDGSVNMGNRQYGTDDIEKLMKKQ